MQKEAEPAVVTQAVHFHPPGRKVPLHVAPAHLSTGHVSQGVPRAIRTKTALGSAVVLWPSELNAWVFTIKQPHESHLQNVVDV